LKLTPIESRTTNSGFFSVPRGKFWTFLGVSSGLLFNLKTHQGISVFLAAMPSSVAELVLVGSLFFL